MHVKEGETK